MDYAVAVNDEIKDLFAAGADIVQIDEPYMQARPERARQYGLKALNRALEGVTGTTAVHICFGYAAIIHQRPSGYSFLPELAGSPDCGMKYLPRDVAFGKMKAMVEGARLLRREFQ
jgi:5-methyltetrahydropteroyltriglutamate--homocysteine methyltransferase